MAHDVEQRVTKSDEVIAWFACAATAVLQYYAVILWAATALTLVYLILLPPNANVITGLAWADLEALQGDFPISLLELWLSCGIGYKAFLYFGEGLSRFIDGDTLRVRTYIFNALFIALAVGVARLWSMTAIIAYKP